MKKVKCHILIRFTATLVLAGFAFSVLFGQGTHAHSIFDHLSDHGDIHVYVHVHHQTSDHAHDDNSGYDFEDSHNHPISNLSLKSVRTPSSEQDGIQQAPTYLIVNPVSVKSLKNDLIPTYLDLPPPDLLSDLYHFSSFSLRAPPVG